MTSIIILNWNGFKDTIECLESLYQMNTDDFFVVVVDNGSTDNSLYEINEWLDSNKKKTIQLSEGKELKVPILKSYCILYALKENYGFAKGNNLGIALVSLQKPDKYLLLNNDTIVDKDFLVVLTQFSQTYPIYKVLTPLIKYYSQPDKIWNCGGNLFFGFRKYFYANKSILSVKEDSHIDISFVTGCALLFNPELLIYNKIFTEKFFFGEEDFEFSMRMKKQKIKMACVSNSQIFHKVSSSTLNFNNNGKLTIHYLNGFINIRQQFNKLSYYLWVIINIVWIPILFYRNGKKINESVRFIRSILEESKNLNDVSKANFEKKIKI